MRIEKFNEHCEPADGQKLYGIKKEMRNATT